MAPRKRVRASRPDDPDKDPWTGTQVTKAYGLTHPQVQALVATQGVQLPSALTGACGCRAEQIGLPTSLRMHTQQRHI